MVVVCEEGNDCVDVSHAFPGAPLYASHNPSRREDRYWDVLRRGWEEWNFAFLPHASIRASPSPSYSKGVDLINGNV